jgi:hypothetical protein
LLAGRAGPRVGLAGIQVVPVHDGVEAQRVGALCLPAPERADGDITMLATKSFFIALFSWKLSTF